MHDAAAQMCNHCHVESDEEMSKKIKNVARNLEAGSNEASFNSALAFTPGAWR